MMSGMATKSLGLEQGKGVEFYNFQDISDVKVKIIVAPPHQQLPNWRACLHSCDAGVVMQYMISRTV